MNILDGIEKLITEHGSAQILRERLLLAKEQMADLERKNAELSQTVGAQLGRIAQLEHENRELRSQSGAARAPRDVEDCSLPDEEAKILKFLAEHDGAGEDQVTQHLGLDKQMTKYHLQELNELELVSVRHYVQDMFSGPRSSEWHLSKEGRRYLVKNHLLS